MMNLSNVLAIVKGDKRAWICALLLFAGFAMLIVGSRGSVTDVSSGKISEEERIEELCRASVGVGNCVVTVSYEGDSIAGIIVLCDGGDDIAVKKRISDMLTTLYDIGYNRIKVDRLC